MKYTRNNLDGIIYGCQYPMWIISDINGEIHNVSSTDNKGNIIGKPSRSGFTTTQILKELNSESDSYTVFFETKQLNYEIY